KYGGGKELLNKLYASIGANVFVARLLEEERYQLPFLFVFLLALNLPLLGSRDLWAPVEPRYGEIARVMLARGEWIVPTVNGEVYTDKPVLYFWLVLGASHFAAAVSEWAVRLPSALSACGLALVTYALGKKYLQASVGFLAALMIATTARVIWEARWAHTDMLFTFLFICSLYFLLRIWLGENDKKTVALAFALMGLATLTKGLIGFVLPGLVFLCLLIWTREWAKLRALNLPLGIAVFLLVTAPWFVAVGLRTEGLWINEFIWRHHVQRYVAGEGHEEPFYYYFVNFPADFLPWTLILGLALWSYWPERKALEQPVARFLAAWFGVVFLFFSLSNTKRTLYLLPLFPPAALLAAQYLWDLEKGRAFGIKAAKTVLILIGVIFVLAGLAVPWAAFKFSPSDIRSLLPLAAVAGVSGWFILRCGKSGRFFAGSIALAAAMALSLLCAHLSIMPIINQYKSPRVFAEEIKKHVRQKDPLYMYNDTMNDFNFYLEREVIPVVSTRVDVLRLATEKRRVYLLARNARLVQDLAKEGSGWDFVTRGTTGGKQWFLLRTKPEITAAED
ncbi:MAG: ArnT family glycosyltransferase, partial [Candidatus Binatia bacterium]